MAPPRCADADCAGVCTYVRSRFQIAYPGGALIAEEVPSVQCQTCGRTDPAPHARRQVDAVLDLAQEVPAVARKDFTSLPLQPGS